MIPKIELQYLLNLGCVMFDLGKVHPLIGELCEKYEITVMITPRNKFTLKQKLDLMNQGKYQEALRIMIPDKVEKAGHFPNLDLVMIRPWYFEYQQHIELALLHELGHHIKNTETEEIADRFAIDMMDRCYFGNGERLYQHWLIWQYHINVETGEYTHPDGKYAKRDEYIQSHILKKRS